MALKFLDGFEHYGSGTTGNGNMTSYGAYSVATSNSCSTTQVRTGTYSLRVGTVRWGAGENLNVMGVGCVLYFDSMPVADIIDLFEFRDNNGNVLCRFGISNSQELILYRANSVEISRSSPGQLTAAGWYHLECRFEPNGATSSIELRINEVTVYTNNSFPIGSTVGGNPGSTSTVVASVEFESGLTYMYMDDLYVWDETGSYNNTFLGDKRVATLFPDADTSVMDWTPNSGTTEYTQIDEASPDGDTTYITSSTSGDDAEFNFQSMPTGAIGITGVMLSTAGRKTDTGPADIRADILSGASSSTGDTQTLTTSYVMRHDIFETDPNTGSAWTKSGIDSAKIRITREV